MRVLVVTEHTADDRKSLAAVRALGRRGVHVEVASDTKSNPPLWSRYCRGRIVCPDPVVQWADFSEWLRQRVVSGRHDVVLPLSDYPTMALINQQADLENEVLAPVPTAQSVALTHDKLELGRFAAGLGIEVPQTWCPDNRQEVESIGRQVDFPCVLKLRRGAGAVGLSFPSSAAGLLDAYDMLPSLSDDVFTADRPLVQEFIPGRIHDACMLFNRGEPRAIFTQERLLMHPGAGGVGIYNQSTDEPEVREKAERLLRALDWHGPAMVEFKRDDRDGAFKLLEINARYWGTLGLAVRAGVDFPWLACRMAIDGDVEPVTRYRVGLKYRWSCRFGSQYVRRSENKLAALKKFYAPGDGSVSDFQLTDPLPDLLTAFGGFALDRQ